MKKIFSEILSLLKVLAITFLVTTLLTTFIINPVVVNGSSMMPTLQNHDVGIAYVITKKIVGLNRFATVTVYVAESDKYLVKRVIGLPGETIYAKDGVIYINDEPIEEEYLDNYIRHDFESTYKLPFTEDFPKVRIPDDYFFLMGDNRRNSKDSRDYGPFSNDAIKTNSLFIFYPFSNFGIK